MSQTKHSMNPLKLLNLWNRLELYSTQPGFAHSCPIHKLRCRLGFLLHVCQRPVCGCRGIPRWMSHVWWFLWLPIGSPYSSPRLVAAGITAPSLWAWTNRADQEAGLPVSRTRWDDGMCLVSGAKTRCSFNFMGLMCFLKALLKENTVCFWFKPQCYTPINVCGQNHSRVFILC